MTTASPSRLLSVRLIAATAAVFALIIAPARAQTLLRDAEIEEFLRDYSEPLFEAAGIPAESVETYLIGDPSLNAFVTGGLKVFVHTGLITAADTPNQIEGVLAHETGHLAGGHQQRGSEAAAAASRPAMLSLVLGAGLIAAGAPDAGMAAMGLGQRISLGEYLAYSRGQESAADQAAVGYLETVGSSGAGLIEFFEKLRNRQLISASRIDPYLQTHPVAMARVSRLRDRVAEQGAYGNRDSEEEIERLRMIQAKINGFLNDSNATLRQYPLADKSEPARYARAVAYYRASRLDEALEEIESLIAEEPENPFFEELKGQMLFEHGKVRESVAPHRKSVELGPDFALLKINLGRALVALEQPETVEEGIEVLRAALRQEPDNSFAWGELARGYAYSGNAPMASLAQANAYFESGNLPQAHRFATRAKEDLEPGTPEHLQAVDIIRASEDMARRAQRGR